MAEEKKKRHGQHAPSERKKIVVILDTCAIIRGSAVIPEEYFISDRNNPNYIEPAKRPKTFLDVYAAMPATRIKGIHIPDIIYAEALGKCWYTKETLNAGQAAYKDHDIIKAFFNKKSNPVSIHPTQNGKELIALLLHLERAQIAMHAIQKRQTDPKIQQTQQEAYGQWSNVIRKKIRTAFVSDEGERIIGDYIKTLKHDPVIFVTDDEAGLNTVASRIGERDFQHPVRGVNTPEFLTMLQSSGLFNAMGLKPTLNIQDVHKYMQQQERSECKRAPIEPKSIIITKPTRAERNAQRLTEL